MNSCLRSLRFRHGCAALAALWFAAASPLAAQILPPIEFNSREAAVVDSSTQMLGEVMQIPAQGIPRSLLASAEGLVLVPSVLKGGFVIGVERGRGVVVVRDPNGGWQLPQFMTITGGSIGWQAGIQATDLILVFKSKRSVQGLLTGKFTIGVDAAAAAGPVGRDASVATDGKLQAEIYSYSRSRGLFAGFSVNGAKIDLDRSATQAYYQPAVAIVPGQANPIPASALRLLQVLSQYTNTAPPETTTPAAAAAPATQNAEELRRQLAATSQRLAALIDASWKPYLALPDDVYAVDRMPTRDALAQALARYQNVVAHPEYAVLTSRPEFQETYTLLQKLVATIPAPTLALPPPPQQ
jgi:lipid-binding SYLF domain-containing protein